MSRANTDQERVELAQKEYEDLKLKREVTIFQSNEKEKTIGTVSQVNNKPTGEQSFIITDKYTPPTASSTERNKVKELQRLHRI